MLRAVHRFITLNENNIDIGSPHYFLQLLPTTKLDINSNCGTKESLQQLSDRAEARGRMLLSPLSFFT